jgi:hypothetical protein
MSTSLYRGPGRRRSVRRAGRGRGPLLDAGTSPTADGRTPSPRDGARAPSAAKGRGRAGSHVQGS